MPKITDKTRWWVTTFPDGYPGLIEETHEKAEAHRKRWHDDCQGGDCGVVEVQPVVKTSMAHTEDWRNGVRAAREVVISYHLFPKVENEVVIFTNWLIRRQLVRIDALLVKDKPDGKDDTRL